jgi:uncharacterized protein (TIGR02001 family)
MAKIKSLLSAAGLAAVATMASAQVAAAEDSFTWSFNIGGFSDYMFRGFTQTDDKPAIQGGVDIGYGIWYAGVWLSNTDEQFNATSTEIDLYTGVKPVLGPVTFDFGVIYYGYPSQDAAISLGLDVDYWEFKAGASFSPITNLTLGTVYYYGPDYSFETGESHTIEGNFSYTLPAVGPITPAITGAIGYFTVDNPFSFEVDGTPVDDITYWNIGLAMTVEKITFDARYYGSDKDVDVPGSTSTDDRFVFGAKVVLP